MSILSTLIIFGLWLSSLTLCCRLEVANLSVFLSLAMILGRTFLHTGLFIVAHDAANGSVWPQNRPINDFIGSVALTIYALLPYGKFVENHFQHHRYPASSEDPDFHDSQHKNLTAWYLKFMATYLNWRENLVLLVGMTLIFHGLRLGLHLSGINLVLFWAVPSFLSSMQLFYFGTFLPHRESHTGYADAHCARSSNFPIFWSFLTSYHFGYHWEHHEYPHLPWFEIPTVRRSARGRIKPQTQIPFTFPIRAHGRMDGIANGQGKG